MERMDGPRGCTCGHTDQGFLCLLSITWKNTALHVGSSLASRLAVARVYLAGRHLLSFVFLDCSLICTENFP